MDISNLLNNPNIKVKIDNSLGLRNLYYDVQSVDTNKAYVFIIDDIGNRCFIDAKFIEEVRIKNDDI